MGFNTDYQAIRRFQEKQYENTVGSKPKVNKNKYANPHDTSLWETSFYEKFAVTYKDHVVIQNKEKNLKDEIKFDVIKKYIDTSMFFSYNFIYSGVSSNQLFINFGYLKHEHQKLFAKKQNYWMKSIMMIFKKMFIKEYKHYVVSKNTNIKIYFFYRDKKVDVKEINI